jgi:hypothetical protein
MSSIFPNTTVVKHLTADVTVLAMTWESRTLPGGRLKKRRNLNAAIEMVSSVVGGSPALPGRRKDGFIAQRFRWNVS